MDPELVPMDWVRDALANGLASGLTAEDLLKAAWHADSVEGFNEAVNIMGLATPPFEMEAPEWQAA